MNVYFTSDQHFFHKNLLSISKERARFESLENMHQLLITNWNNRISNNDTVYVLGDFSFGNSKQTQTVINKLNGTVVLIKGNHDKKGILLAGYIRMLGYEFEMVHNPIDSSSPITLHGHIHKNNGGGVQTQQYVIQKNGRKFINVNCELWNYTPVNMKQIYKLLGVKK